MQNHYSGPTRLLHGALAVALGVQLFAGLVMQAPSARHAGNGFFTLHEDGDVLIGALALGFWIVIATRRHGTDAGMILPWFSVDRRAAVFADALRHWAALRRGQLAGFQPAAPLATAVQGLGLVFVTAMAATGVCHMMAAGDAASVAPFGEWLRWLHGLTGILAWPFVILHGLMSLLHHYADEHEEHGIWSFAGRDVGGNHREDQ